MYATESNLMYGNGFKQSSVDGDLMKYRDYLSTADLTQSPSQLSASSGGPAGLARYRSAPSSFFATLLESSSCGGAGGGGFSDLLTSGEAVNYDMQFPAVKQEVAAEQLNPNRQYTGYHEADVAVVENNLVQAKMVGGGLARQSSSPAGFFSNLAVDNGFSVINDVGNYRGANGISGKSNPSKRLNDHINFSTGQSSSLRYMPQIAENINENTNPENEHLGNGNITNNFYVPTFENDSWNESSLGGLKRSRENEDKFSGFTTTESQNADDTNYPTRLTHHMSLPKTSGEMAAIEKYLQFQQDAVPCKIRAKRGFATHPRSIAERVRRTRISDRMKKLQDLFPNMDKQTNTAEMLDLAVEYIKDLQTQVQTLTGKKAKCTCSK